jgi:hypothetical protein
MSMNEPDGANEDYGYGDYAGHVAYDPDDRVSLTIRPVYAHEAADYLDDLLSRRRPPDSTPPPPSPTATPEPAEPVPLRDELQKMGWF